MKGILIGSDVKSEILLGLIWYQYEYCIPVFYAKLIFLQRTTSAQLRICSSIHLYSLHRHVSVTLVTIFRLSYSNDTSDYRKCVRKIFI
jgi:hypothetical protein